MEGSEIIVQKRQSLQALKDKGVALYPSFVPQHTAISQVMAEFQEGKKAGVCGRITAKRSHGKAVFLDLQDASVKIQLYLQSDIVGEEKFNLLCQHIDIADFLFASGPLFKTRTGEPTLKVEDFILLAKALRPLPEKWHGLKDVELRYRMRYLDLISSKEVKEVFIQRSRMVGALRDFLDEKGYLEVETPMLHVVPGGAAAQPFKTRHNEYALDLYLRIAPELYLKELLVGGFDKVYEINRSFRNEGVSTKHNPEFTMLEVYCAYADYTGMMQLAEELIVSTAKKVLGKNEFVYQGKSVDLNPPWQKISFAKVVKDKFDINPDDTPLDMLKKLQNKGFARQASRLTRSQTAKVIEDILAEEMNLKPTFVMDYFTNLCPLAKAKKDNPLLSERFELYIAALEVANAYSELNDPLEQKKRFEEEIKELGQDEKKALDCDYLLALEHGMPPAAGLGIGIDRLAMLFTDQPSIREVILFPLLKP